MTRWQGIAAIMLAAAFMSGCDDQDSANSGNTDALSALAPAAGTSGDDGARTEAQTVDKVVDIVTAEVSTACLRELPEPSVASATPARLTLTLENFTYSFEEGRHRFTHDRRFKETTGIGLYIYRGKVCVEDAQVCADACVRYRVEPGGSLTQRGHHIATPVDPDRMTLQYWARDDAGNTFTIFREIRTDGETIKVSEN
jgi:hypothetical protein